jgi:hypothetical protein
VNTHCTVPTRSCTGTSYPHGKDTWVERVTVTAQHRAAVKSGIFPIQFAQRRIFAISFLALRIFRGPARLCARFAECFARGGNQRSEEINQAFHTCGREIPRLM